MYRLCENCNSPLHAIQSCRVPRCRYCFELGHIERRCPSKSCENCHQKGYIARDCPQKIKCWHCERFGHRKNTCPVFLTEQEIKKEDILASMVAHGIVFIFPPIEKIVNQLLENIVAHAKDDEYMKHIPYNNVIDACGGQTPVATAVLASIDPVIRELEGQPITKEALQGVFRKQPKDWTGSGGYLDMVTDSREPDYMRFYVGQSETLHLRI